MIVPSIELSEEKLQENLNIMRQGNKLLKECAVLTGMTNTAFRTKLFKNNFKLDVWNIEHIPFIQNALPAIHAVRAIEWDIMRAYSKLAYSKAMEWSKYSKNLPLEDHYQEAMLALLDAIYSYDKEDAQFITYVWYVMQNRLSYATNNSRMLSPLTNEAMDLLNKFNKEKAKTSDVSDQEICARLKFTEDEISVLAKARVDVIFPNEEKPGERTKDYTRLREITTNESSVVEKCSSAETIEKVKEAIDKANLNDLERKIIESYMDKPRGFTESIESMNPNTKKPYSRQSLHNKLQKALRKVKNAYQEVA